MLKGFLKGKFYNEYTTPLLVCLLAVDFFFIGAHILIALFFDYSPRSLLVDTDRGYPEMFQYAKYLAIVLISAYLIFKKGEWGFLPWLCLFLFLFIDDAFQIHEGFGRDFAEQFDLEPGLGLRAVDYGELLYAAIVGGILFWLTVVPFYKGSNEFRKTFIDIVILFGFFLFFGIGIDMLHQLLVEVYMVSAVFALIEDGGEMIAISLMVWYFLFVAMNISKERAFLSDFILKGRKLAKF